MIYCGSDVGRARKGALECIKHRACLGEIRLCSLEPRREGGLKRRKDARVRDVWWAECCLFACGAIGLEDGDVGRLRGPSEDGDLGYARPEVVNGLYDG